MQYQNTLWFKMTIKMTKSKWISYHKINVKFLENAAKFIKEDLCTLKILKCSEKRIHFVHIFEKC